MDKTEPALTEFKAWLKKGKSEAPLKGLFGKAIDSILSRWSRLIRYLENGHITPDNNAAEKAIRPFVTGRKNWLFSGSSNGADAAAALYSLIETAEACGLDAYQYLRLLFEKIPYARTEADYEALLPQNITD